MKKQEFLDFISAEQRRGAVRFSLGFNSKGEIDLCLRIQHDKLAGGADFTQGNLCLPLVIQYQLL